MSKQIVGEGYDSVVSTNAVDSFRLGMLRHMAGLDSFTNSWDIWKPEILKTLSLSSPAESIFNIGDHLSGIFQSRTVIGRDNAALSQGGTAWECLVCWYLNLVFWGTDVVAIRPHANFLPEVIKDALSVSIQNVSTNTESDLVVFSIPNGRDASSLDLNSIDRLLRVHSREVSMTVVQCKTNWNDNSQIPMLWDLIYNSGSFRVPNVSIGRNGVSPVSFQRFSYSFVTVPTSRGPFLPTKLPVLRVRGLTGGNYWGHPTTAGVAKSLKEFFTTNFPANFSQPLQEHIESNLTESADLITKFTNLNF